jgi:hypothetical protein
MAPGALFGAGNKSDGGAVKGDRAGVGSGLDPRDRSLGEPLPPGALVESRAGLGVCTSASLFGFGSSISEG